MSAVHNPPSVAARRWMVFALAALLAVVITGSGIAWYYARSAPIPPTPPDVKGADLEPAVASAVQVIREQVLKDPHSAKAWGDLGEVFLANELEEPSRPCFVEAERLDPADPRWPYFQAGPMLNRGDREAALPFLQKAVDRDEAKSEAVEAPRLRLAETLLILGRLNEAGINIQLVVSRRPDDPRVLFDAGLLAISREDWQTARSHLLACLGSPFTRKKARVQLAAVCQQLGDASDAQEYRLEADRLPADADWVDPFVAEYLRLAVTKRNRYRLAEQLESAGRLSEAASILRPMTVHSDDYLPYLTLGKVLAQTPEQREAEQALRQALRMAPDKVQTHYYLALLLVKEGEALGGEAPARAEALFREAADLARQALALKPDYGYAHMALGLAYKHLGQKSDAVAAFRKAVRSNPEFAELHLQLGEALADDGQDAEARPSLEQALRLAPPDAPWRQQVEARLAKLH